MKNLFETIKKATELYGGTPDELSAISEGFQNKVYSFTRNHHDYIMRITSKDKRTAEMLNEEISWIQCLKKSGVPVSVTVASINNQFVEVTHDFFVTVFEKASGGPVKVQNRDQWNTHFFQRWGRLLGDVHQAGKRYSAEKTNIGRLQWNADHPYNHDLFKDLPSEWIRQKYVELVERIKEFSIGDQYFGLIHNDFHQGNFFVDEEEITLFDFDDCAYFYFAYDIATAFYHAYWQHTSFNSTEDDFAVEFLTHFLTGYRESNVLTSELIDQLPDFLKLRELFLYVLFLKVWDIGNLQDWQEYTIHNLKTNIENNKIYADLDSDLLTSIKNNIHKPL
ncbi:phosphotransferase enzyme family protein [Fictibacillus halophilus]|uniref:phosphotransferase enzyme family protein n=1 Tax=Fictibacillus halophilus TaxID=1610490 RepID=UPI001CFB04F2|nr:phosphotransferase [Fictibacillus halophilus]